MFLVRFCTQSNFFQNSSELSFFCRFLNYFQSHQIFLQNIRLKNSIHKIVYGRVGEYIATLWTRICFCLKIAWISTLLYEMQTIASIMSSFKGYILVYTFYFKYHGQLNYDLTILCRMLTKFTFCEIQRRKFTKFIKKSEI